MTVISRAGRGTLSPEDRSRLGRRADLRFVRRDGPPGPAAAVRHLAGGDVLVATNLCLPVLDERLLERCPRLREVVLYATGFDHVDVALLDRRGVRLTTLPDYATVAVAEHALALLLALAARVPLAHDRSRGLVPPETSLRGVELAGRTLGVVGTGRIGRRLARIADGVGMRVLGSDVDPRATAAAAAAGVEVVSLPELVRRSDAVAVCASTLPGCDPILGAAELARLGPDAFVVNVARPSRVDTGAAAAAIRAGRLRGYAVDDVVLDPAADGDLLAEGRVLQTGHSAWWRDETLERGRRALGRAIGEALDRLEVRSAARGTVAAADGGWEEAS